MKGFEFTFASGNSHFAVTEFVTSILQAGLELSLFSEECAFSATGFIDLMAERVQLNLQFVNLISARKNGVVLLTLALPAGVYALLAQ